MWVANIKYDFQKNEHRYYVRTYKRMRQDKDIDEMKGEKEK